jgi:hypothetical protein
MIRCEPLGERHQHLPLDLRLLIEQPSERAVGDHEGAHGRGGGHGRRAWGVRDERDLAEEIA